MILLFSGLKLERIARDDKDIESNESNRLLDSERRDQIWCKISECRITVEQLLQDYMLSVYISGYFTIDEHCGFGGLNFSSLESSGGVKNSGSCENLKLAHLDTNF